MILEKTLEKFARVIQSFPKKKMSWGSSLKIPEVRQNPQGNPVSFRNFPSSEEFFSGDSGFSSAIFMEKSFVWKNYPQKKVENV